MTDIELLLVVVTIAVAGFLQGLTGFGFGIAAMAALPLVMPVHDAQSIVTLMSLAACGLSAAVLMRHFLWQGLWGLLLGACLGVPIGFYLLTSLPEDIVRRSLGAVICGMVVFDLLIARRPGVHYPTWSGVFFGFLGGSISGAFNIGGPALVAYTYARPVSKEANVGTLSFMFLIVGLVRSGLLVAGDHLHMGVLRPVVWSVIPMLVGILVGNRFMRVVPQRQLRAGVLVVLLILGLKYLLGT